MTPPEGPKLNLGCGPVQPSDWVNIDGSMRAWLVARLPWVDRLLVRSGVLSFSFAPNLTFMRLHHPLPYADDSIAVIFAGELWEHFEYPVAVALTRECLRVLKPGGVIRLRVPDTVQWMRQYLSAYDAEMAKPRAERSHTHLHELVKDFFSAICTRRIWLGSMGHTHKWMYDEVQLFALLESVGFVEVERRTHASSRIPDVAAVETHEFLTVEAIKPH